MQDKDKSINSKSFGRSDNKQTIEDLKRLQSMDLGNKIQVTQARIMEWYNRNDKKCYVSFSGGKDSTVLADITAQVCSLFNCKLVLWFSDTGLEYPEVREHVKKFPQYLKDKYNIEVELIMDYPKDRKGKRIIFRTVLEKYGYPIISKEVSKVIYDARSALSKGNIDSYALKQINDEYINPKTGELSVQYNKGKWKFLIDAPFVMSNRCCNVMKKSPAHKFDKQSGLKPIIGTMASESKQRKSQWLQSGCNSFDANNPSSKPISFWLEQDVLEYLYKYKIPYASVYGNIEIDKNGRYYTTGCNRTGCIFCGYGCHLEKEPNKFQMLKETHPKLWEYCMKPWNDGGLGMREVLEYIGVKVE